MYVLFIDCRKSPKLHHTKSKSNKYNNNNNKNSSNKTELENRVTVPKEIYLPCHVSL